jgi:hypothetical protein
MVRELHLSAPAVPVRQRTLLQGMCRLFDANRGSILITAIDTDTGNSEITTSLTVEAPFSALEGVTPISQTNGGRSHASPGKSRSNGRNSSTADGSCHEAFASLKGVRVARLSLTRGPGRQRFTPTERNLIDVIHNECAWVYDDPNGSSRKQI